jgi:putative hydrolase of the HAD superfamily
VLAAVTFDFWGTLAQDTPETLERQQQLRLRALRAALARAGAAVGESEVAEAYDRSGELMRARYWSRHLDPGLPAQVRLVLECCAPGITGRMATGALEQAVEDYVGPALLHLPPLVPGVADAVRALAARGVILGVICNTGRTPGSVLRRVLAAHDLLRYFRVTTYSDEVGRRKPDPEIFRLTLASTGAAAVDSAHIGDSAVDDVVGARDAGMLAIHYTAGVRAPAAEAHVAIGHFAELAPRVFGLRAGGGLR